MFLPYGLVQGKDAAAFFWGLALLNEWKVAVNKTNASIARHISSMRSAGKELAAVIHPTESQLLQARQSAFLVAHYN